MLVLKTILMIGIVELAVVLIHSVIMSAIDVQVQLALVALLSVMIPIVVAELRAIRAQRLASAEKAADLAAAAEEKAFQREEQRQIREETRAAREAADNVAVKVEEVAVKAEVVATALAVKVEEVAVKAEGVATALAEKSAIDADAAVAKAVLVAEQAAKIEEISETTKVMAKTTEDTLTHVNSEKGARLQQSVRMAERTKTITNDPADVVIYDQAVADYDAHQKGQAMVDATAGDPAKPC